MAPSRKSKTAVSKPGRISLKDELEALQNTAPKDFDPEALEGNHGDSDSDGSGAESDEEASAAAAREHYVAVGKSKLRKPEPVVLDPKYNGTRVTREKLLAGDFDDDAEEEEDSEEVSNDEDNLDMESGDEVEGEDDEDDEIDSDTAFASEDEDKEFTKFKFKGSRTTKDGIVPTKGYKVTVSDDEDDEDEELEDNGSESDQGSVDFEDESEDDDEDGEDEDDDEEEEEDDDDEGSDSGSDSDASERAELRKLMATDQKTTQKTLNSAVQSDIAKGTAVRAQQATFDYFLGARIKMQKALVATNTLPLLENATTETREDKSWKDAEGAALKLWTLIRDIRHDITSTTLTNINPKKRKLDALDSVDEDTPLSALSAQMSTLDSAIHPWRTSTLDKWASKTQNSTAAAAAAIVLPASKRLNNNTSNRLGQRLSVKIDDYITQDPERLLNKTRVARSCAPFQQQKDHETAKAERAASASSTTVTPSLPVHTSIYDDTDFYQTLLKALIDQRMLDNNSGSTSSAQWALPPNTSVKTKKIVDTKASKGRKLRYQVHEKLQNFMAPEKFRGGRWWEEHQVDELFGSLLGQKSALLAADDEERNSEAGDAEDVEMRDDGFTLFG
ncbi:apoptosis-antagonizing transcription factor [Peziza echinospora]|nr:apoptosis-antagonizing transcription factor [Peziza echinospora]